ETGEKLGFIKKMKNKLAAKKWLWILVIGIPVLVIGGVAFLIIRMRKRKSSKRKNRLRGLKAARTRREALKGYENTTRKGMHTSVHYTNRKKKPASQLLGMDGNTRKTKKSKSMKGVTNTEVAGRKKSQKTYMKDVIKKARAYRKQHPAAKWATALKFGHHKVAA
ncbi:MAG: hypothetical protein KJ607_03150, partial [Bacteroidetes bacterium]|nr:hypothetical protein [Bacteroidota bacterium]